MAKKIITNKEQIILVLLLIFRFLNSKQIQEFLGHKDHRRINSWLKDLTEKGYIVREFKPIFGQLTKPAVYYLSSTGRSHLKHSYQYHFPRYLKRISKDNKISKAFKIKCQILADWYLTLLTPRKNKTDEIGKNKKDINQKRIKEKTGINIVDNLVFQLSTDTEGKEEHIPLNTLQFFTPSYYPAFPLLDRIKPDAYLRKKLKGGVITHGLLLVLDAYVSRLLLRYRLQGIFKALDEEYWENDSIHSLHFYFLCPNNQVIIYLRRSIPRFFERYSGGKPTYFHLGTRNQLYMKKNGRIERIEWVTFSSSDY